MFETTGITEFLVAEKKINNKHSQAVTKYVSVLLKKALSLILHKLQVLQKAKQCSVIHSNSFTHSTLSAVKQIVLCSVLADPHNYKYNNYNDIYK